MTTFGGKDFLLQVDKGSGTFETVAGLRSKSIALNGEAVDITSHGSNQWREILANGGVKSVSVSGSGVMNDDDSVAILRTYFLAGTLAQYKLRFVYSGDTNDYWFIGYFLITSFEMSGEYNGEATWTVSLESSGEITYEAET
jgi:TP901-1 family phage major tail protein